MTWGGIATVVILLLAVVVGAVTTLAPQDARTYENETYAFSIEPGRSFRQAGEGQPAAAAPSGIERPDFMITFVDPVSPRLDGSPADVVDVKVVELGDPVAADDPRLRNLPQLLDATLSSQGAVAVKAVAPPQITRATTCAAEYTDPWGRHGMTFMAVAGSHLYTLDVLATQRTRATVWPRLVRALASFRVGADAARPSPPRTYVDQASGFSITCDRRFVRLTVTRGCWAADAMIVLADPLSGVAANGRFNDGIVVYAVALPGCPTATQRRSFVAKVRSGLDRCGMSPSRPARLLDVNGLPAYRLCSHRRDGSGDLLYVVFSGDRAYFVEGCAQDSTWATDKRLFEAAMQSVEVPAHRPGMAVSPNADPRRAA